MVKEEEEVLWRWRIGRRSKSYLCPHTCVRAIVLLAVLLERVILVNIVVFEKEPFQMQQRQYGCRQQKHPSPVWKFDIFGV